jgi:protein gp37
MHPERLMEPLRRTKPSRIFVNSMSDLFHPDVPLEFIDQVFGTICMCHGRHTFQILTKRPARMLEWFDHARTRCPGWFSPHTGRLDLWQTWIGVSVEDQQRADERIPLLLQTPAAVRFVSLEPLLGPVDLTRVTYDSVCVIDGLRGEAGWPTPHEPCNHLDWLIVGAETGPGARPCKAEWVQSIIDQARAAGVPIFLKDNLKWPERIQEWPEVGLEGNRRGHPEGADRRQSC